MTNDPNASQRSEQHEQIAFWQQQIDELRVQSAESHRDMMLLLERGMIAGFKRLREERGWSQEELSRLLGEWGFDLHQTAIARLEAGKRPLRVAEMYALSYVFKLPPAAVFYLPKSVVDIDGMQALSQLLQDNDEIEREYRKQMIESFDAMVEQAARAEVERRTLVELMRRLAEPGEGNPDGKHHEET